MSKRERRRRKHLAPQPTAEIAHEAETFELEVPVMPADRVKSEISLAVAMGEWRADLAQIGTELEWNRVDAERRYDTARKAFIKEARHLLATGRQHRSVVELVFDSIIDNQIPVDPREYIGKAPKAPEPIAADELVWTEG